MTPGRGGYARGKMITLDISRPKRAHIEAPFSGNLIQIEDSQAQKAFVDEVKWMIKRGHLKPYIRVELYSGGTILTNLSIDQIKGIVKSFGGKVQIEGTPK